jgi:dienelactone hydrolase
MAIEELTIPSGPYKLAAVCHLPRGQGPFPVIVACHGLLSSKESRKYKQLADIAGAWGLALLRFDFRAMGESSGGAEAMTLSGRLEDAQAVLDFLKRYPAVDASRLGLMGSSLGGVVAWATAQENPSVGATVVWATPCQLHDLVARRAQPSPPEIKPLPEDFFDDLEGHALLELPAGLERVLIIHGEDDEIVPVSHAHHLFAIASEPKRLIIIPGTDHRITDADHRQRAAEATIQWFATYLGLVG